MNNVLEVEGLCKSYKSFALHNISFSIPDNCITGFIGVNGAGKSTTIKSVLRLIKPQGGSIRFWGMDIEKHEQEIKNRIGVVLDEGAFYSELSMSEMKRIIAPAYSNWQEADYKVYMEQFSLNPKQKIATLSKGMRAKFALVLALSHNADLLIMDEPTSGLDPLVRSEFMDILLNFMKKDGKSVFFSTHITSDLDRVADMLILINNGNIVFQQDKDLFLDTHRRIKGLTAELSEESKKLFLTLRETAFGFEGVSAQVECVKKLCPSSICERATIEDIMLAYIGSVIK